MTEQHVEEILRSLSEHRYPGTTGTLCKPVPSELVDAVLAEVRRRWITPEEPWQSHDSLYNGEYIWPYQWRGSLPVRRLSHPEHVRGYATIEVWQGTHNSEGGMGRRLAHYAMLIVIEHAAPKSIEQWVTEVRSAMARRDLTYAAWLPKQQAKEVLQQCSVIGKGAQVNPVYRTLAMYRQTDATHRLPTDDYAEMSLCWWREEHEDPELECSWLCHWVDVWQLEANATLAGRGQRPQREVTL